MNKTFILGATSTILLSVVTTVNATSTEHTRLAEYYNQTKPVEGRNYKIQYSNFNMEKSTGQVDWVLNIHLDPCDSDSKIELKGNDQIQKTLTGYRIKSSATFVDPKISKLFKNPIQANTVINLFGNSKTNIIVPELKMVDEDGLLTASPITIDLRTHKKNTEREITKFSAILPKMSFVDEDGKAVIENVSYTTNQDPTSKVVKNGSDQFKIQNITIQTDKVPETTLSNLNIDSKIRVLGDKVNSLNKFTIQQLNIAQEKNYQNIQLNFNFKDLDTTAVNNLMMVYQDKKQCKENSTTEEILVKSVQELFNKGAKFESKQNKITTPSGTVHFNADVKIKPNTASFTSENAREQYSNILRQVLDVKLDADTNKQVIYDAVGLIKKDKMNTAEVQELVNTSLEKLEQQGTVEIKNDRVKWALDFNEGQIKRPLKK